LLHLLYFLDTQHVSGINLLAPELFFKI
jgi:hypothetical protein